MSGVNPISIPHPMPSVGYFVEPTIVETKDPKHKIMQEVQCVCVCARMYVCVCVWAEY